MKTVKFFLVAVATLLFANNTISAEEIAKKYNLDGTTVRIAAQTETKIVMVQLANVNEEVKINLADERGTVLVNEVIKTTTAFTKKYNLKNLEAGNYRLTITKKMSKTVQPFQLTESGVVMKEDEQKEVFLPNVVLKGDKIDVNVLLGNYSNIHVKIFANDGRTVFEESNYVVLTLHKRYDLVKLEKGTYLVEIVAGDSTEYFPITL
jgi:hypothetical protein